MYPGWLGYCLRSVFGITQNTRPNTNMHTAAMIKPSTNRIFHKIRKVVRTVMLLPGFWKPCQASRTMRAVLSRPT